MKRYCAIGLGILVACNAWASPAESILEKSGIRGGLAVVVGCGEPELLTDLGASKAWHVQGLDTDPATVAAARDSIRSHDLYGRVSANVLEGTLLPFADDLVNLVVLAEEGHGVAREEIMRVLAPGGALLDAGDPARDPVRKPVPTTIDEWTHFLYGPGNNAVSKDTVVAPVGSLKWKCGPLWARSHEFTSSLNILVSAGGRVFYVVDEGITSVTTPDMPERWVLVARDAFNGKKLWRMPLPEWRSRLGKGSALRSVPPTAQRCLVADKDRVYVSSLLGAPIKAIDAATGEVLMTYGNTAGTREFVQVGNSILLYQEEDDGQGQGTVARLNLETGALLWTSPKDKYKGESLGASADYVIYHNKTALVCLDFASGRELWRTGQEKEKRLNQNQATYIVHDDLILECGSSLLIARDAKTGAPKWEKQPGKGKAMRGQDSFVARGCVWHASGDNIIGYDLATGEAANTVDPTDVQSEGHHLRCYRAKATENYLITQYRGVEFVSITGQENSQTDWTRGACSFGVVPANGLLYVPPNPCFCFPGVKVLGLNAFAPRKRPEAGDQSLRLVKGPAFDAAAAKKPAQSRESLAAWPTYRHDSKRHGSTTEGIGSERVSVKWESDLKGKVSPPVMARGMVYVAVKDQHAVCALDGATGETAWRFTARARIDSPPTIHEGLALFGSADGYLYCVTADTGELVWKFRAAPAEQMIMVFDQLESSWPVHGSVLVQDDIVYCTAGRSTMLDGGIWLYGLNPRTGELLHETNVDTLSRVREDADGKPLIPSYNIDGAHSDILVSEGGSIHMGPMVFDHQLNRQEVPYAMDTDETTVAMDISKADYIAMDPNLEKEGYEQFRSFHRWQEIAWPEMTEEYKARHGGINLGDTVTGLHLVPTAGFLDDSWFNRTYWMYSTRWPGWYHAHRGAKTGQILVVGSEQTYALQAFPERNKQSPLFTPGAKGYLLFADSNDNEPVLDFKTRGATKGIGFTRMKPPVWHDWIPVRVRGMVEAGDVLFVAGTPDVVPEEDPMAGFEGRRGAILRAVSATDGAILSELRLDAPPVFDGLIAAENCLFMSTEKHRVICLAASNGPPSAEEQSALEQLQADQATRRKQGEEAARKRELGRAPAPAPAPKTKSTAAAKGKRLAADGLLPRDNWRVVQTSSVEPGRKEYAPDKILDGDPMTSWHSKWSNGRDPYPHEIIIDLGEEARCQSVTCLPRQDRAQNGRIKEYSLSVSTDGNKWEKPVAKGTLKDSPDEQQISFDPVTARYIKLVVESGYEKDLTAIAELNVSGNR